MTFEPGQAVDLFSAEANIPPLLEADKDHPLLPKITDAISAINDPEIHVDIFSLGLIYKIKINDRPDGMADVDIEMALTSPTCPTANEIPGWVETAVGIIPGIDKVTAKVVYQPAWTRARASPMGQVALDWY